MLLILAQRATGEHRGSPRDYSISFSVCLLLHFIVSVSLCEIFSILGSSADFLGLSSAEAAYVQLKLALSRNLQEARKEKRLTQHELAHLLKSRQSRVAKMEADDPTVSLDLLVRSLLALGTSRKALSRIMA